MSELMFPKTKTKKKRKTHRASIFNQDKGNCLMCELLGEYKYHPYTERHHVFCGIHRAKCEEWGITAELCLYHHKGDINGNSEAVHFNSDNDQMLREYAQKRFEEMYSHELFVKEFGKSWL